MKAFIKIGAAFGVFALSACNQSPREEAAENVEANFDMQAENLEAAADNSGTEAGADTLQNQADALRNEGENVATDLTTNDADTNLANGM